MSVLTRSAMPKLFASKSAFIDEVLIDPFERHEEMYSKCLNVKNSTKEREVDVAVATYGLFEQNAEGADATMDNYVQGWEKTFVHLGFAKAAGITKVMLQDDAEDVLADRVSQFSISAIESYEQYAADLYNLGFSSETSGDGVAIFSASHTIIRGGTYSNLVLADLDSSGMKSALSLLNSLRDEANRHIRMKGAILMVGTDLEWKGKELLNSTQVPETNANAINSLQSANLRLVVNPFLKNPTAWFVLADTRLLKAKFYWKQKPEYITDTALLSRSVLMAMDYRCVRGCSDPRGLVGSEGL